MRNLFDQYTQPENRLTHALAVCLDEDRLLLRDFLSWVDASAAVSARDLVVIEQSLPGDASVSEDEAERRGLPDIVIHDGEGWCVLVESKIQARLTADQLARHERTLRRRGFDHVACIALTKVGVKLPLRVTGRTWSGLYAWLGEVARGREWPERLRAYLRVAEVRLTREEYLTEGTLTMFDGFKFSADNPYTYGEAKRLLNLAMAELRNDRSLRALGMDARGEGRGAITGRDGTSVWDFLPLQDRPRAGGFTRYPHLTLGIHTDHLEVAVTIPNGVVAAVRRRLAELGVDAVVDLNHRIIKRAQGLASRGASVEAYALQRHYKTQRSPATTDARVSFRLETSQPRGGDRIKPQPEWANLFASLLKSKRSNIQFGYVIKMAWDTPKLDSREALQLIAAGWRAMEPLLDVLRGKTAPSRAIGTRSA